MHALQKGSLLHTILYNLEKPEIPILQNIIELETFSGYSYPPPKKKENIKKKKTVKASVQWNLSNPTGIRKQMLCRNRESVSEYTVGKA